MNFTKMSKIILNSEANYNKMMEDVTRVVVKKNELHTIDVRETHNN
jgi:predicted RNA-binding protein